MFDPKQITAQAAQRLENPAYPGRRLALLHSAIALGCSLVLTIINYFLNHQVAGTGGLGGIGTRTVLQSIQSVMSLGLTIGMPFWEYGFLAAAMGYSRQQPVGPKSLLKGFHKFGPLLRLMVLQLLLYTLLLSTAIQIASSVVVLTPLGQPMMDAMQVLAEDQSFLQTGVLTDEMLMSLVQAAMPAYIAGICLFALAAIAVAYRLRLAPYMALDGQRKALRALLSSNRLMKGSCVSFFKLDLHFWWYWALQGVCSALAFGDVLLPALGVQLPVSADAAMFIFYGAQLALALLLAWRWRAGVETTFAVAYDSLLPKPEPTNTEN